MSLDRKSLARLRLLVAVARADGKLQDDEVNAIREAFAAHRAQVDLVLAENIDPDAEIAALGDDASRLQVYEAAYAIAYADGRASHDEIALLRRIYEEKGEDSLLAQVLGETRDTLLPSTLVPIADPVRRSLEIDEDIIKYSTLSAVVGAMPVPGIGILNDLVVVGLQVKLVRDIGQYCGHKVDAKAARSLLASMAGATGMRIALNNLARLVPGFGSVFGAVTSFATTFAVGRVAATYFGSGAEDHDPDAMKSLFANAKAEGVRLFEERQASVDALRARHGDAIRELNEGLAAKSISQEDYDRRLAALMG